MLKHHEKIASPNNEFFKVTYFFLTDFFKTRFFTRNFRSLTLLYTPNEQNTALTSNVCPAGENGALGLLTGRGDSSERSVWDDFVSPTPSV